MKTYRKILIALLMAICAISCAFAVACTPKEALAAPQNVNIITNLTEAETTEWLLSWDAVDGASSYEVYVNGNYKATAEDNEFKLNGLVGTSSNDIGVVALPSEKSFTKSEATTITYTFEKVTKGLTYTLLEDGTYSVTAENAGNAQVTGRVVLADTYKGRIVSTLGESSFNRTPPLINGATLKYNEYTTSVRLPASLKVVEDYAFYGCKKIEEVVLPETVTFIGSGAFSTCEALTTINMPQSLVEIGSSSFYNCTSLKNIQLHEGLQNIGGSAFSRCKLVNIAKIPQTVQSIGYEAFYDTAYYNDQSNWQNGTLYLDNCLIEVNTDISGAFFIKEGTRIIASTAFCRCDNLTEVTIPEGVKIINASTMYECEALTAINLPKGITKIYKNVFSYCSSLEAINFDGTMAEWLAIEKEENWCNRTGDFTAICTDGKLDKLGNVVE